VREIQNRPFAGRRDLVDDQKAGVEGRAVFGVDLAVDAYISTNRVVLANFRPPCLEGGRAHGHAAADDGDQTPAWFQALQRLLDMGGADADHLPVAHATTGAAERRVHHDDGRSYVVGQDVVDLLGVLGEDAAPIADQRPQKSDAALGARACDCSQQTEAHAPRPH
jgi:hypothetical protein